MWAIEVSEVRDRHGAAVLGGRVEFGRDRESLVGWRSSFGKDSGHRTKAKVSIASESNRVRALHETPWDIHPWHRVYGTSAQFLFRLSDDELRYEAAKTSLTNFSLSHFSYSLVIISRRKTGCR